MAITYTHKSIEPKPKTYKVGDTFILNKTKEPYILATVAIGDFKVALICLNDGHMWANGVKVHDYHNISEKEIIAFDMSAFVPCDFILIPTVQ